MTKLDNEIMTYDEMWDKYPSQWVVYKPFGKDHISCYVIAILSEDEIDQYRMDHIDEGLSYQYTGEGMSVGVINVRLAGENTTVNN